MSKVFALVASVVNLVGYALYNSQIIFGNTKSPLSTWLLWTVLVVLNLLTYVELAKKDWVKIVLPASSTLACIVTTVAVISKGSNWGTLAALDWCLVALGGIAGVFWLVLRKASYASAILMLAVTIGFAPIYWGLYLGTAHETPTPWFIWTVGFVLGVVAVILRWEEEPSKKSRWQMVYPVTCVVLHLAMGVVATVLAV